MDKNHLHANSARHELTAPLVTISHIAPSLENINEDEILVTTDKNTSNLHVDRTFHRKESILSSEISLFIEKEKPKIPDGGWGWFVVVACFVINMISDGVSFVFGLLLIELVDEFQSTKSATSWIGSLFMSLPLIAGPIASALVDKYGCRSMTIIGGLICTLGLTLSSYVRSLGLLYVTFGVIGGLGMSLCFVTAVVSIAFWFEKKRTIALGLAASGTGFGTAVFSPIATYFLQNYRWRGTLLIFAGIFANMCVCGVLMRDPKWLIDEENREKKLRRKSSSASSLDSDRIEELKAVLQKGGDTHYLLENVDTTMDLSYKDRFRSNINLPTFIKQNEEVPIEVLKQLSENKQIYNVILENYPNLLVCRSSSERGLNTVPTENTITSSRIPVQFSVKLKKTEDPIVEEPFVEQPEIEEPFTEETNINDNAQNNMDLNHVNSTEAAPNRAAIGFFRSISHKAKHQMQPHTYLKNVRFRKHSIGYRGAMLNIHRYRMKASSCPDLYQNSMLTLEDEETWYEELLDILKDLTNFSLFLELHFLLLSLSTIILFVWFIVPYFYLADHMQLSGYDETQSSFAISIIGITNTLGMIILGWLGDRINLSMSYAVCLILCGVSVGAILFFTYSYTLLLISSGFFGLFYASCLSLTPSLLAELVPLDDFTMAYGLILLCQGIGNLTGPPLAGLLFDLTKSYHQSFYQAAFWIIISGVLIGFIPFTKNRKFGSAKRQREKHFVV